MAAFQAELLLSEAQPTPDRRGKASVSIVDRDRNMIPLILTPTYVDHSSDGIPFRPVLLTIVRQIAVSLELDPTPEGRLVEEDRSEI
jgi:hypothetical protein